MNEIIKMLLIFSVNLVFASGSMIVDNHEMHKEIKKKGVRNLIENSSFNLVLSEYEKLYQAFFDNKKIEIKKSSKAMIGAINKVEIETISKALQLSKKKLIEISKSDNIDKNQNDFNTISQEIHMVLTNHASNKKYARYYCPMVGKYWIQNIEKTKNKTYNPYAASTMPHCGGVK